jgi:hypothetical protein
MAFSRHVLTIFTSPPQEDTPSQFGRIMLERRDIPTKCRHQIAAYFVSQRLDVQVTVKPIAHHLHQADPIGVRTLAGHRTKTGSNNSLLLAQLLRDHRLPMSYEGNPCAFTLRVNPLP